MKTLTSVVCSTLIGLSASIAMATPNNALFNTVGDQARALGYYGYDVTVCLNASGKVRVGGLSFWSAPLQIYLVDNNGTVIPTVRLTSARVTNHHRFDARGTEINLDLADAVYNPAQGTNEQEALLSIGNLEISEKLTCYTRLSGLE